MAVTRLVKIDQAITSAEGINVNVHLEVDDVMVFGKEMITFTNLTSAGQITLTRQHLTDLNNLVSTLVTEGRQAITPG